MVVLDRLRPGGGCVVQVALQGDHARANTARSGAQGLQKEGRVRARAAGGVRVGARKQAPQGATQGE